MTGRDALVIALEKYPQLSPFGFSPGPGNWDTGAIESAMQWLSTKRRTKHPGRSVTSYGYKHTAEGELNTYISNGSFIVAAVALGFKIQRIVGTPNCFINIARPRHKPAAFAGKTINRMLEGALRNEQ